MIKKKLTFLLVFVFFLFSGTHTYAAKIKVCPEDYKKLCTYDLSSISKIVSNGITILFVIATIASLFFLIFGGIKWITSGGDKAKLEESRNMLVAAAVGLAVTFLSFFILNFVLQLFGLPTAGNFTIPTLTS